MNNEEFTTVEVLKEKLDNSDLPHNLKRVGELMIEVLKSTLQKDDTVNRVLLSHAINILLDKRWICSAWHIDDVFIKAEEMGVSLSLTEQEEILHNIIHNLNAEIGINWDVIGSYIFDYVEDKKKA